MTLTRHRQSTTPPFVDYKLDGAYDEMFDAEGRSRSQYGALYQRVLDLTAEELRHRQQAADLSFLHQGITFTVYGRTEGTERIFPYDLLPRIITAAEWATIERGLAQRITALNLFLKDIYNEGKILADGIVPADMIYSSHHYRREMRGLRVPRDAYVTVVRHGLGTAAQRRIRRAGRQSARPQRCLLYAGEPAGDETRFPAHVQQLRRPPH